MGRINSIGSFNNGQNNVSKTERVFDLDKEISRIDKRVKTQEEFYIWNAYYYYFYVTKKMEPETLVRFCQDAYMEVRDGLYLQFDELGNAIFDSSIVKNYRKLLSKYSFSEDDIEIATHEMLYRYYYAWVNECKKLAEHQISEDADEETDDDFDYENDDEYERDTIEFATSLSTIWDSLEAAKMLDEFGIVNEIEHTKAVNWFASQALIEDGIRLTPCNSSREAYERISDVKMLIWLAAALGENLDVVRKAAMTAQNISGILPKCNCIRDQIPFERISDLMDDKEEEYMTRYAEFANEDQETEN